MLGGRHPADRLPRLRPEYPAQPVRPARAALADAGSRDGRPTRLPVLQTCVCSPCSPTLLYGRCFKSIRCMHVTAYPSRPRSQITGWLRLRDPASLPVTARRLAGWAARAGPRLRRGLHWVQTQPLIVSIIMFNRQPFDSNQHAPLAEIHASAVAPTFCSSRRARA